MITAIVPTTQGLRLMSESTRISRGNRKLIANIPKITGSKSFNLVIK